MGDHSTHEAAGAPFRKARAWAWFVFWLTAGTSVLYNCYHALVGDHMPWYTGVPAGFVPLVVAIGVLEFSGAWRENKVMQVAAWAVTGGAMAWSAVAINSVVHRGFALGVICDTAALAAMFFLLNGPTAAQAVAKMDAKVADLLGRLAAERSAREQEAARHARETAELRSAAGGEIRALTDAREADLSALRGEMTRALEVVRGELAAEREARAAEQAEAARALDRAVKAARASAPAARAKTPRAREAAPAQDDMANELRALMEFRDDPALLGERMGGKLAGKLGVHPSTGRRLHARMVDGGKLRPEYEAMAAPLSDGSGNRA